MKIRRTAERDYTSPPTQTGGREARERAERALADVRDRRARVLALRGLLVRDMEENHYGQAVVKLFRGGQSWST